MSVRLAATEVAGEPESIPFSSSGVTFFTGGSNLIAPDNTSLYGGAFRAITLQNKNTTTTRTVTVRLCPAGATPGPEHNIFGPKSMAPNAIVVLRTPWLYKSLAFLVGYQDTGTDVQGRADADENHT